MERYLPPQWLATSVTCCRCNQSGRCQNCLCAVRAAFHNGWGTVSVLFGFHCLKPLTWLLSCHITVSFPPDILPHSPPVSFSSTEYLPAPFCTHSSISYVPETPPCVPLLNFLLSSPHFCQLWNLPSPWVPVSLSP